MLTSDLLLLLGLSQRVRYNLPDISLEQNRQMARLCDLSDPNVKIIYVSPVPVSEEFQQYFSKLLGLKPAVESGDVEQQSNIDDRFTIVVPDALESFPVRCIVRVEKLSRIIASMYMQTSVELLLLLQTYKVIARFSSNNSNFIVLKFQIILFGENIHWNLKFW